MMADFVSLRGGGLLALGGRRAFAEGGYAGTAVAEALPLQLEPPRRPPISSKRSRCARRAWARRTSPRRLPTPNRRRRTAGPTLPALTTVNPIRRVKPGAAVLLEGHGAAPGAQVVLAYQRYGAGKALALPVQDSWLWQMHADVPVEDQTHETLLAAAAALAGGRRARPGDGQPSIASAWSAATRSP